jgi:hypothetical protein
MHWYRSWRKNRTRRALHIRGPQSTISHRPITNLEHPYTFNNDIRALMFQIGDRRWLIAVEE